MFQKVGNGIVLLGGAQGEWSLSEARELRDSLNEAILDLESRPTPVPADKCPSCSGSGRYQPNYPTASRPCLACGGTGIRR